MSSASNSFSRLRCGLRLRAAAELGNDSSSVSSAISSSSGAPGASSVRSLPSLVSTASSRVNPAACSSCAMNGIERAVLVVRRAEIAQTGMGLGSDVLGKRGREPRLADARLARDQHHPSFAALCLCPAPDEQLDFLVTPDERRLPERNASNRLTWPLSPKTRQARCGSGKPASACDPRSSRSNSSPICCRVLAAMTRLAGVASACSRAARFGRLTDDRLLLRRALADQIADDHQPGGDSDPRLEFGGLDIEPADRVDRAQCPARTARSASSSCARG